MLLTPVLEMIKAGFRGSKQFVQNNMASLVRIHPVVMKLAPGLCPYHGGSHFVLIGLFFCLLSSKNCGTPGLSGLLRQYMLMCVTCLAHGEHLVNCGHYCCDIVAGTAAKISKGTLVGIRTMAMSCFWLGCQWVAQPWVGVRSQRQNVSVLADMLFDFSSFAGTP